MMCIKFIFLSALNLIVELLAYPVVPVAVLFANKETGRLPKIFQWWETHDDLGWGAGTYEHAVKAVFDKYGKRIALIYWLWRNKAYTFSNKFRANPDFDNIQKYESGVRVPPKFGPYYSYYEISDSKNKWFDLFLGVSFVKFHLYFRCGWKIKPIVIDNVKPTATSATGMFSGISIRSDDWDDYQI